LADQNEMPTKEHADTPVTNAWETTVAKYTVARSENKFYLSNGH